MIGLSKMAWEKLREENSSRIPNNFKQCWNKSKIATIWLTVCLIAEIPLVVLKHIVMWICFIPHEIYEKLDEYNF